MTNKSCEIDVVDTKFLKEGMDYILEKITDLVNFSLQYGQYPRKWKTSIVRLMIKKINSHNWDLSFQNFRQCKFSLKGLGKNSINSINETF